MAETVGYHLRGDPGGEAECGVGMAKVMEANSRESELGHSSVEELREVVGMERTPVFAREDKVEVGVLGTDGKPLGALKVAMLL